MNSKRLRQVFLLALTLIGSNSLCLAQAKIVKQLDEHSYVVEINGKQFKAVDNFLLNEQQRSFDVLTAERDAARKGAANADKQVTILTDDNQKLAEKVSRVEQQRDSARRDLQDARVFIAQQKQLLDQETAQRKEYGQFIPHGKTSGFWGKVLTALDSPQSQAFWKLAVPTYQMIRCQ